MKVAQLLWEEPESLFLTLLQKLLDQGKTVYLDALGKTEMGGPKHDLKPFRAHRKGRVQEIKQGHLVYDFQMNREYDDRTISNSFFMLAAPPDDYYTIRKNDDGTFTIVDAP